VHNPLEQLSLDELRQRTSVKWRHYPPDVLPLWVAEMDVQTVEPVARALHEAIAIGDTGYPHGRQYAEALAGFAADRWSWEVDIDHTALVADVMTGMVEMLKLVTNDGDAVVINSPTYPPFYPFIEHANRRVIESPLTADHRLDLVGLDAAFATATSSSDTAAFVLCNPHNPTGTVHTTEELKAVTELAAQHGVRVVVDEIHAPIVYAGEPFAPYLSLAGTESAFTLLSASKAWNLAGLKAAVAVAGADAARDLARMPKEVGHGPSHLGIIAHSTALRHGGEWLDALVFGLDQNRRLLSDLVAEHLPGIAYSQPQGTYLAWLDCRPLDLAADPAAIFLERGRVALNSGPTFGTGGDGHVRLNLATSSEIITEAVRRMAAAV